jgi:hypothetical protein
MLAGALAKTGFVLDNGGGNESFRTSGIWIQTVLLVIAVYTFPFVRGIVRFGTRLWPRLVILVGQSILSLAWGVCMMALAREKNRKGNLIAYATALALAAIAATAWSIIAVWSHARVERRILSVPLEALRSVRRERKEFAYTAALLTRPRYGYSGTGIAVMRWGDIGADGKSPLEISLADGADIMSSSGGMEGRDDAAMVDDTQAVAEWDLIEHAAGKRWSIV